MNKNVEDLKNLINDSKSLIDNNGFSEVLHYYNHDEYEIALEGLLLEFITLKILPSSISLKRLEELAIAFNLKDEPNLDSDFWKKFQLLIKKVAV